MLKKSVGFLLISIIVAWLLFETTNNAYKKTQAERQITHESTAAQNASLTYHEFPEIGISFSAPKEMVVTGEMLDRKTFVLYVQKATNIEDYYQLYGLLQIIENPTYDTEGVKSELIESSIVETEISGFKAVQGQFKGERNRLITFIFTDKGIFNLATANPTPENGEITNAILKTMVIK